MYKFAVSGLIALSLIFSSSVNAQELVHVYAASSMTNAVNEVKALFESKTGKRVIAVFGGSSSLARQIEKGAPADVYISANSMWVEYLKRKALVKAENSKSVAQNSLVLIGSTSSKLDKFDVRDKKNWLSALRNTRLAIGQTDSVPAGIYAKQSLKSLNVWDAVKDQTAPVNNVRVALALVERGETDLGIVYQTDAHLSDGVTYIASFPDDSHAPIVYPAAKLNEGELTDAFYQFLSDGDAQRVFQKYGFR